MRVIASLTDQLSIRRILDHLGLSTPPQDRRERRPMRRHPPAGPAQLLI
jgi:hypothetical protein